MSDPGLSRRFRAALQAWLRLKRRLSRNWFGRRKQRAIAARQRNSRNNRAFRRQGEWFFIPVAHFSVDPKLVLTNEPISRGNGGKPHIVEQLFPRGGTPVYVSRKYPRGLKASEYRRYCSESARCPMAVGNHAARTGRLRARDYPSSRSCSHYLE